jgi:hypothetical protein
MSSTKSHQFTCSICGEGFEKRSRLERHTATSHPPRGPSAAYIEKALSGIQYPRAKEGLVLYTSQKVSTIGQELFDLIKSLPERTYRDSAKVATALGD